MLANDEEPSRLRLSRRGVSRRRRSSPLLLIASLLIILIEVTVVRGERLLIESVPSLAMQAANSLPCYLLIRHN